MFEFFINRFKFKPKFDSAYLNAKASYLNQIRFAVSLFYFAMGLCFASWASRIPDVKTALNLNEAELGSILFAVPIGQLAIMPFSGKVITRYGSKSVLLVAMALYILSLLALGLSQGAWQLSVALFFFGISGNLSNIAVNTQGVDVEALFKKAIMSSFHGAWSIAGFTGAIIGLGVSTIVPMIYSVAGKNPNVPAGEALTIVSSVSFLGFLLGPPVIGHVAEMSSLRVSFAIIGVFGFLITFLVSRLSVFPPTIRQKKSPNISRILIVLLFYFLMNLSCCVPEFVCTFTK